MSIFTSPYVGTFGPGVLALPGPGVLRDPGLGIILSKAASWYGTSSIYTGDEQSLPNRVSPAADPAQIGSTTGVDTNDPLLLPHDGEDYVWSPGTAGNFVRVGSVGVASTTTPLDLRIDTLSDTAGDNYPCHFSSFGGIRQGNNATQITFYYYDPSSRSITVTLPPELQSGIKRRRLRVVATPDGVGTVTAQFYWRASGDIEDSGGWTMFGSGSGSLSGGAWQGLTGSFEAPTSFSLVESRVYKAVMNSTVINPSSVDPGTVYHSASGLKTTVVTSPVAVFDGVDDYIQLPASDTPASNATTGKHTVVLAVRNHSTAGSEPFWSSAATGALRGLTLYHTSGTSFTATVRDDTGASANSAIAGALTPGDFEVVAAVVDDGAVTSYVHSHGFGTSVSTTGLGVITHAAPTTGRSTAFSRSDFEGFTVLSFPDVALAEGELDAVSAYLKGQA